VLKEGRHLAEKLAMPPLLARIESALGRMDGTAVRHPDMLTRREIEVISLVASGLPNKAIAEELFISPHTVGNHLRNIYSKTQVHNRVDLARYAAQKGLSPS
jgi:DNA-binding NarL/FixJ family response regulator